MEWVSPGAFGQVPVRNRFHRATAVGAYAGWRMGDRPGAGVVRPCLLAAQRDLVASRAGCAGRDGRAAAHGKRLARRPGVDRTTRGTARRTPPASGGAEIG